MSSPLDVLLGAQVKSSGVVQTSRRYLDFRSGITLIDDPANDAIQVAASGGGGGTLTGDTNGPVGSNRVTQISGDSVTHAVTMAATALQWGAPGSSKLDVNVGDGAIELWNNGVRAVKAHGTVPEFGNTLALVQIEGGVQYTTRTISSNITLDTTTKDFIGWVDASAPRSIQLPAPGAGRSIVLVNVGASTVTITRHSTEKINGTAASYVVPVTNCIVQIYSNGTDWFALPVFDPTGIGGYVPTARAINTTAPLTGGGTLASDLTLAVSNATTGAVGVIQLTQDLAGSATGPQVVGLTGNISSVVAMKASRIAYFTGTGGRIDFSSTGIAVPTGTFSAGTNTAKVVLDSYGAFGATYSSIWLGAITPGTANVALASDGASCSINGTTRVQISINGNVRGIATTNGLRLSAADTSDPSERLEVNGNALVAGHGRFGASTGYVTLDNLTGATTTNGAIWFGNVSELATNYSLSGTGVDTYLNVPTGGKIHIDVNANDVGNWTSTGLRVGDGTTATAKLDVQGSAILGTTTSAHQVVGSVRYTFRNVSSSFTIDTTTTDLYLLVDTSAARSITLPAATAGRCIKVKDKTGTASTNNITIVRAGSETIDGVGASFVYATDWGSFELFCDGTNWFIFG